MKHKLRLRTITKMSLFSVQYIINIDSEYEHNI